MKSFSQIYEERKNRILAFSKMGLIALEGLSQIKLDQNSKFTDLYRDMAEHIPKNHQNHKSIDIPEYRVVGFFDSLTLIAMISEIEIFFQDFVLAVLIKHPEKIGKKSFELKSLVTLTSIDDIKVIAARCLST